MRQFYQHQDDAFRATKQLVIIMAALILATVLLSGTMVAYVFALLMFLEHVDPATHTSWLWVTFGVTSAICSGIVLIGAAMKTHDLKAGGRVVAKDLGGTRIVEPQDADQRKLLNIVEEMSIASGVKVPRVYVLEGDDGINAFAAGYDLSDAVIGVTRGAIKHLNRDQLQGVIAHEFSHIFNGDMRLNMRMLGLLHGVLCISILAKMMVNGGMRSMERMRGARFGVLMIIFGGALWIVGLAGTAVSLLVKAATSRQREFLADAYAVQFTRNPEGLAGAMKIIAGHQKGSRVSGPKALEASHMFFAEGCGKLASLMASHPPIVDRIVRLDPGWDGVPLFADDQRELDEYRGAFSGSMGLVEPGNAPVLGMAAGMASGGGSPAATSTANHSTGHDVDCSEPADRTWVAEEITELESKEFIEREQSGLSDELVAFIQLPQAIPLVLYVLWISHSKQDSTQAAAELLSPEDTKRVLPLLPVLSKLTEAQQVMLFDNAVARINDVTGPDRVRLAETYQRIVTTGEEGNVFHWMWARVLAQPLGTDDKKRRSRYGRLDQVAGACEYVLSMVCHVGTDQEVMAGFAFQRGLATLGVDHIDLLPAEACSWEKFETALEVVGQLSASPRRQILASCTAALTTDREISAEESFILRGICRELGYELPSVLPGQPLAIGV